MPTNNFKLFDENKANLLSDTEYANATQRLNGVQTGVASSQLNNKFAYQVSLVAYAIAQIMNQNGLDASDTLSVSAFVGNLGGALLQKVADKASSAEAVAGVLENKYISPATMKAAALLLSGGVMNGTLDMNNNQIINLPTPTSNSEPATKKYVDGAFGDPLLGMTKIATFTSTIWKVNTNFSTIKLAKICIKIDITRFEWSGAGYYLSLKNSNTQNAIYFIESRSGTGYGSAINTVLSYYPSFISYTGDIAYLNYYSSGGLNFAVKPNTEYNEIRLRGGSYTGTMELYAKWYD